MGCTSLKSFIIPGSVRSIKDGAFEGCSPLHHWNQSIFQRVLQPYNVVHLKVVHH